MFEQLTSAPTDPIFGLNEAFKADARSHKINLGVGVYKDSDGLTPVLQCVKQAEQRLVAEQKSKSYLSIDGDAHYVAAVKKLLLGQSHTAILDDRVRTAQAPGGTGALRIAAELFASTNPNGRVWVSNPTWINHRQIFETVGIEVLSYDYFNADDSTLNFEGMLASLNDVNAGDMVILHACCHNPTGIDPDVTQWQQLAQHALDHAWVPLFDIAYQGFGQDTEQDAQALRYFATHLDEMIVASSFSKNFGLYSERIGAITLIGKSAQQADVAFSQVKRLIRANYSNPPSHGALVVATILHDPQLTRLWQQELTQMRERIKQMRSEFVRQLADKGVVGDFSFIQRQQGMFSFSGLTHEQVERLKQESAIYIVGSGRINVAGMTVANLPQLVQAIASVSDTK